jgi:hypothetical protein
MAHIATIDHPSNAQPWLRVRRSGWANMERRESAYRSKCPMQRAPTFPAVAPM